MKARVLVADDEPLTVELLGVILTVHGFDVTQAHDGEQALRLAREYEPDLLLLDVNMPGLRGPEVARRVRRDPALARTVVVLVSSTDECDVDWRAAGADAFLQKPVDVMALPGRLEQLLTRRAAAPSTTPVARTGQAPARRGGVPRGGSGGQ